MRASVIRSENESSAARMLFAVSSAAAGAAMLLGASRSATGCAYLIAAAFATGLELRRNISWQNITVSMSAVAAVVLGVQGLAAVLFSPGQLRASSLSDLIRSALFWIVLSLNTRLFARAFLNARKDEPDFGWRVLRLGWFLCLLFLPQLLLPPLFTDGFAGVADLSIRIGCAFLIPPLAHLVATPGLLKHHPDASRPPAEARVILTNNLLFWGTTFLLYHPGPY